MCCLLQLSRVLYCELLGLSIHFSELLGLWYNRQNCGVLFVNFYYFFVMMCNKHSDLRPSALAQLLGISKSTISNWKKRNTFPRDSTIAPIAEYFDCSIADLKNEYEAFVNCSDKKTVAINGDGLYDDLREFMNLLPTLTPAEVAVLLAAAKAQLAGRKAPGVEE